MTNHGAMPDNNETVQDLVLRKMSENHIRVAVVGNVDAGKSSFIGTQVSGALDDGRGSARAKVTKHSHELTTGRTSTIGTHLVGLREVNGLGDSKLVTTLGGTFEGDIARTATRLVSYMDLAGHEKYLKTTVAGIARGMADYALVMVNAMQPPTHMTLHHLKLCVSCNIPVIVIMTKVDRAPSHVFQSTKQHIQRMLRDPDVGLKPFVIRATDADKDIETVKNKVATWTPIIPVSCVTGEGLDILRKLLLALPQRRQHAKKLRHKTFEFLVEDIYQVPGVGTVLSGFVSRGEWSKGDKLCIGPLKDGSTLEVVPKSVHVAQTCVDQVWAGHSVCFALPKLHRTKKNILSPKGMVAMKEPLTLVKTFKAQVIFVKGNTMTLSVNRGSLTAHILNNKQQVKVIDVETVDGSNPTIVRQGDQGKMTLQFHKKQYVRTGMRIILRDGHVRGYGVIIEV